MKKAGKRDGTVGQLDDARRRIEGRRSYALDAAWLTKFVPVPSSTSRRPDNERAVTRGGLTSMMQ